jgi:hypothetical protein
MTDIFPIKIIQNKDWFLKIILMDDKNRFPIPLFDYKAKLTIRNYEGEEIVEELSTEVGDITILAQHGSILCHLTNPRTNLMRINNDLGKYSLVISKNDVVTRILRGDVEFERTLVEENPL